MLTRRLATGFEPREETQVLRRLSAVALVLIMPLGRSDAQSAPTRIALVGATLIDGTGAAPFSNATVLIEGTRIVAVGPRSAVAVPAGTTVIAVANKFVLPGFIDLHMHLTYSTDYPTFQFQTDAEATLRGFYFLEMFQRLGITSVRDVAASVGPIKAAAAAFGLGLESAIRVFGVSKLITSTGGHAAGPAPASPWRCSSTERRAAGSATW